MNKYFCDCCGKEVKTWYVFIVCAECEHDQFGRVTKESLAHNLRRVHEPKRIFCTECKNRAMEALEPLAMEE